MPHNWKPAGYTSAAPYLIVDGAEKTVQFLERVFGATRLRMIPGDKGRWRHAEVRIDDTVVMIADSVPGWPPQATHVHVYVSDVVAVYERALKNGAEAVQAPEKKEDADRRGGFRDAGGTTWWVATQVEG